ncbi:hypothetical protein [Rhizobium sp. SGZ-381]|uniref:hypothetical protein n=1 Tax=Rhizobium sp. SGZ-381 TaxID=3342800 RepID=UPI003670938B
MATGFEQFERELRLAVAGLQPEAINAQLAAFAKQELRRVIASGEASPIYERYVNNVRGLPEEAVQVPNGIVYQFVNWPAVIRMALEELRSRVPVKSGRYAGGFMVLANQRAVADYKTIPVDAEVIILNARPYTRKMESGALKVGKRHFEATKNSLARRFRDGFAFDFRYLDVKPGMHPDIPYILKRCGRRKDRQAGMPIGYPSLIINTL